MIDYSLSTNRLKGIIQSDVNKKLFKVGCVGKLILFYETDGRKYIINLSGINYFQIKNEILTSQNFRVINVKIKNIDYNFNLKHFNKTLLLKKYKKYTDDLNIQIDYTPVDQIKNEELIKFIVMSYHFQTTNK